MALSDQFFDQVIDDDFCTTVVFGWDSDPRWGYLRNFQVGLLSNISSDIVYIATRISTSASFDFLTRNVCYRDIIYSYCKRNVFSCIICIWSVRYCCCSDLERIYGGAYTNSGGYNTFPQDCSVKRSGGCWCGASL